MKGEFICIVCPQSCIVDAEWNESELLSIDRSKCKLAWDYVWGEIFDPRRMVSTSVPVAGGDMPLVSIKTDKPIPKDKIMEMMKLVARVDTQAPVGIGEIIVSDVLGTGVNLVATRKISKAA